MQLNIYPHNIWKDLYPQAAPLYGVRLQTLLDQRSTQPKETNSTRRCRTSSNYRKMYTKQEWRRLVARSDPSYIPLLPKTTLDDLKAPGREEVMRMYRSRNWEFCLTCKKFGNEYVLKKCCGCGIFPGQRALYCSRKCQREGWPVHKDECADSVLRDTQVAIESGVPLHLWQNTKKREKRRDEGMRLILKWALDQIWASNPTVDWEKQWLSVDCRSHHCDGKGPIRPVKFQLEPIPKGVLPPSKFNAAWYDPDTIRTAMVQVYVDDLPQEAAYIPLECPPNPKSYLPQWPWVLATIMRMQNHNAELGKFRLDLLVPYVEALVRERKLDVLRFKAPPALGGKGGFSVYDFEKWQRVFGNVIKI